MLTTTAPLVQDHHHLLHGTCPASFLVPEPSMSPSIPFSSLKLEGCCFSVTKLIMCLPFLKPISGFPITLRINIGLSLGQGCSDSCSPIWLSSFEFLSPESLFFFFFLSHFQFAEKPELTPHTGCYKACSLIFPAFLPLVCLFRALLTPCSLSSEH